MENIKNNVPFGFILTCLIFGVLGITAQEIRNEKGLEEALIGATAVAVSLLPRVLELIGIVLLCVTALYLIISEDPFRFLFQYKKYVLFAFNVGDYREKFKKEKPSFKTLPYGAIGLFVLWVVLMKVDANKTYLILFNFIMLPALFGVVYDVLKSKQENLLFTRKQLIQTVYVFLTMSFFSALNNGEYKQVDAVKEIVSIKSDSCSTESLFTAHLPIDTTKASE